jgi:hypothetical protein
MDFNTLEKYSAMWKKSKDLQIEQKIVKFISNTSNFEFPITEEAVMSKGRLGFTYKDNATYPNLLEFLAYIIDYPIPIEIKNCHFGPGEIVILKDNKEEALDDLRYCTKELINKIKLKVKEG